MTEAMVENKVFSGCAGWPDAGCNAFVGCRFERGRFLEADASGCTFEDCVFEDCDLSLLNVKSASFKNVRFARCKLQGVSFYEASHLLFTVSFTECQLHYVSFNGMILKKTLFDNCSLRDAVFTQANLAGSSFVRCDLARAVFQHTVLDKADLSTAYNFVIDPDTNSLKKTRFSLYGLPGLLEKYQIEIEEMA